MIVFVTGGIGAGKSTALGILSDFGADTARADDIVHDLLTRPDVQREVATELGIPDSSDRAAIAEIVFRDERKRKALEAIIHPLVAKEMRQRVVHGAQPLVYEVPLMPTPAAGDIVIAIETPLEIRVNRLVERGMSESDARLRIAAQPTAEEYRERADYVIENGGDAVALRAALQAIWEDVRRGATNV